MTALDTIKQAVLGVPFDPDKMPSRTGVVKAFSEMQLQLEGAQAGAIVKDTLAALNTLTSAPYAGIMAWVMKGANAGIYENTGSANSPSWTKRGEIPQFFVTGLNVGAGTANAIQVTTDIPFPAQDGRALLGVPILLDNTTSPPTVSINGGSALPVVSASGADVVVGGLKAGMIIVGYTSAGKFRLLSDQVSQALVTQMEGYLKTFRSQYLGAATSDPTLDPYGIALIEGALYFNSVSGVLRVYHSGAWMPLTLAITDGSVTLVKLASASVDRTKLTTSLRSVMSWQYPTLAALVADTVPSDIVSVRVMERVAGLGGGAFWTYSATDPAVPTGCKVQDAGGRWWRLEKSAGRITPEMCGAFGGIFITTEARAIFDAMLAAGSPPTREHLRLIDRTIARWKRAGVWAEMGWLLAAGKDKAQSLINWYNPSANAAETVSMPFAGPGKGFSPNNGTGTITGPNLNNTGIPGYQQNDAHLGLFNLDRTASDDSPLFGTDSSGAAYLIPRRATDTTVFRKRLNQSTSTDTTIVDAFGLMQSNKISATQVRNFQQGNFLDEDTVTTAAVPGTPILLQGAGKATVPFMSAGGAMSDKLNIAHAEILRDLVNRLPYAVGVGDVVTSAELDAAVALNVTTMSDRFQDFIDYISEGRAFGELADVTYMVNRKMRALRGVNIEGRAGYSRITMLATVGRNEPIIQTGDVDQMAHDIIFKNFIFDFNAARLSVTGGSTTDAPLGTCCAIVFTRHARVVGCEAYDSFKHCFDGTGSTYNGSGVTGVENPYIIQMSEDVKFIDCIAEGAGDDCFTCHCCQGVRFIGCRAMFSTAIYTGTATNSNGFELDDYSTQAHVIDCEAFFVYSAIEIKGHKDAAAARDCTVNGFLCKWTTNGVVMRHIERGDSGQPASASAFNLQVSNVKILNPLEWIAGETRQAMRIYAYKGVQVSDIVIRQEACASDYYGVGTGTNGVFGIFFLGGDIQFETIKIEGFGSSNGIRITSTSEGYIILGNLMMRNGPLIGVYFSGGAKLVIGKHTLHGSNQVGSEGIRAIGVTASLKYSSSDGFIENFATATNIS